MYSISLFVLSLFVIIQASPVAISNTSPNTARDVSSLTMLGGICAGEALSAVVLNIDIKSGCNSVEKKFNGFVADGAYWGWKVYADPYCLGLAQVVAARLCFAILGDGAWTISYGV